jgi:hypothetical protein
MDEIVALLRTGSAPKAAAAIGALAWERMQEPPQDGKPHKPDDMTLIVFSQRRGRA